VEVRVSPEREPHTSPGARVTVTTGLFRAVMLGMEDLAGPGSLRLHHRAERGQCPALKKHEIQRHSAEIGSFLTKAQ